MRWMIDDTVEAFGKAGAVVCLTILSVLALFIAAAVLTLLWYTLPGSLLAVAAVSLIAYVWWQVVKGDAE